MQKMLRHGINVLIMSPVPEKCENEECSTEAVIADINVMTIGNKIKPTGANSSSCAVSGSIFCAIALVGTPFASRLDSCPAMPANTRSMISALNTMPSIHAQVIKLLSFLLSSVLECAMAK